MTIAWYGHLKFKELPLWKAILISWGIALLEYILMVPANRMGINQFNVFQLKIIQEVITLTIFTIFAVFFLKEPLRWDYLIAFLLILGAVYLVFRSKNG
jgi:hypothetical protein